MSTTSQLLTTIVTDIFDVVVSIILGAFNAVILPFLQAIPGLFGVGAA